MECTAQMLKLLFVVETEEGILPVKVHPVDEIDATKTINEVC
jgi:hypothetical protein